LKAEIAKKDMQIETLTTENKEKDEIIADLMAQVIKEKAEKNKINKMNQQLVRTTKIQARKLREKD
jgi:ethanolamine utilization protein EutQ (cupin superfamily)